MKDLMDSAILVHNEHLIADPLLITLTLTVIQLQIAIEVGFQIEWLGWGLFIYHSGIYMSTYYSVI